MSELDSLPLRVRLAPYRMHGIGAAALRLTKRLALPWVEWGSLLFFEQRLVARAAPVLAPGHTIRELTAADLPRLSALRCNPEDLARRLAQGDCAFALFAAREAAPLAVRWVTVLPARVPEANLWLVPGPGELYIYDVLTHPLHRGHGLCGQVAQAMDREFAQRGFLRKLSYVRGDNHSMLRAIARTTNPVRKICRVRYLRRPGGEPRVWGEYGPPLYGSPNEFLPSLPVAGEAAAFPVVRSAVG